MPHLNKVHLRGRIYQEPTVRTNDDGEYLRAFAYVQTMRNGREVGDDKRKKFDIIPIVTKTPGVIKELANCKENDIIDIKGVFTTKDNVAKISYCPTCQEDGRDGKNTVKGVTGYVTPIAVEKIRDFDNIEDSMEYLVEHREYSNEILFMGNLTKEPKIIKTKDGRVTYTQYQIAADRSYRINTDIPENRTDYPHVKSYGDKAYGDKKALRRGSLVLVDGLLQARQILRTTKCPVCGEFYRWGDTTLEIVPYNTEYLNNYRSQEEIAQDEKEHLNDKLKQILHSETSTELNIDEVVEEEDMDVDDE